MVIGAETPVALRESRGELQVKAKEGENMERIRFLDTNDAITVQKENGTKVSYFIFDEYEVHLNMILPHSI